jgi:hypothetical protein
MQTAHSYPNSAAVPVQLCVLIAEHMLHDVETSFLPLRPEAAVASIQ